MSGANEASGTQPKYLGSLGSRFATGLSTGREISNNQIFIFAISIYGNPYHFYFWNIHLSIADQDKQRYFRPYNSKSFK
jgi:hypothetical protein